MFNLNASSIKFDEKIYFLNKSIKLIHKIQLYLVFKEKKQIVYIYMCVYVRLQLREHYGFYCYDMKYLCHTKMFTLISKLCFRNYRRKRQNEIL